MQKYDENNLGATSAGHVDEAGQQVQPVQQPVQNPQPMAQPQPGQPAANAAPGYGQPQFVQLPDGTYAQVGMQANSSMPVAPQQPTFTGGYAAGTSYNAGNAYAASTPSGIPAPPPPPEGAFSYPAYPQYGYASAGPQDTYSPRSAGYTNPGYGPNAAPYVPQKSNTGLIVGLIIGVIVLLFVMTIGAIGCVAAIVSGAESEYANEYGYDYGYEDGYDDGYGFDDGYGYESSPEGMAATLSEELESKVLPYNAEDPDDGELHDGWNDDVAYSYHEETYTHESDSEYLEGYGISAVVSLSVTYPQFEGDLEGIDAVNKEIEATAMRFVEEAYIQQTDRYANAISAGMDDSVPVLACNVGYSISYNNDRLVSVGFNEHYLVGSVYGEFLGFGAVNANLETGEIYTIDDVLTIDEGIAKDWVQVMKDHGLQDSLDIAGEDAVVKGLMGEGELADRLTSSFFVDQNGNVNVCVNFWLSSDQGVSRGWWDVTVPNDQAQRVAKDSSFWDALPKG